jgi:hypothetical protein
MLPKRRSSMLLHRAAIPVLVLEDIDEETDKPQSIDEEMRDVDDSDDESGENELRDEAEDEAEDVDDRGVPQGTALNLHLPFEYVYKKRVD